MTGDGSYENVDLKGCLNWTFRLIKFAGYWFPRKANNCHMLLYALYSVFAISCTLLASIYMQIAYVVSVVGHLEELVNVLFLLLTHTTQTVKVFSFIKQREKIYTLLDRLQEDVFKPKNAFQHRKAVVIVNYTNKMAKGLTTLVIATVTMFALFPLLEKSTIRQLPAKGRYPFDVQKFPRYEAMYAYQIFTGLICGCANAAMDIIAAAFISQVSIQLELLSDSIFHIKEFAQLELKKKKALWAGKQNNIISFALEAEMETFLANWVEHHLKTKR